MSVRSIRLELTQQPFFGIVDQSHDIEVFVLRREVLVRIDVSLKMEQLLFERHGFEDRGVGILHSETRRP